MEPLAMIQVPALRQTPALVEVALAVMTSFALPLINVTLLVPVIHSLQHAATQHKQTE